MRALVMKNNHIEEFRAWCIENRMNRIPLTFTVLARIAIAVAFLFYICNYLARFANAIVITLALTAIALMILSRGLKQRSIRLERLLRAKENPDLKGICSTAIFTFPSLLCPKTLHGQVRV